MNIWKLTLTLHPKAIKQGTWMRPPMDAESDPARHQLNRYINFKEQMNNRTYTEHLSNKFYLKPLHIAALGGNMHNDAVQFFGQYYLA